MILQVGVKILIENDQGEFLILKRNTAKYPEAGETWDIPGGRIDIGSTLIENIAREVREETDLTLSGIPKIIYAQDILKSKERHVVRLTYKGKASGSVSLDENENTEFAWKTKESLIEMSNLDPYLRDALNTP